MRRIPVFFAEQMAVLDNVSTSPSAKKPSQMAEYLQTEQLPVEFIEPLPVTREDFRRAHNPSFVDDILACRRDNGFGNRLESVARSLPYTTGAMLDAARKATPDLPACALVSGFHHAGVASAQGFCTFNGLMVTAYALLADGHCRRVAIVDADYHYGNGTDDILRRKGGADCILHYSFGQEFHFTTQARDYLDRMHSLQADLARFRPDRILYQAGADTHVRDPLGGLLTTAEMLERDRLMFQIARDLKIPIAWNLAGGYQQDEDSSITPVLALHRNTFRAAIEVYGFHPRR